jgi:hypothetical protein
MSVAVDRVGAMPSSEHEVLIELFRHHPQIAAMLLHDQLGVDLPDYRQARLESADLSDLRPTEYRADAVVTLRHPADPDTPVLAVVVEVQLHRDGDKRWSWPVYLATLRARLRCPAMLLVVCTNRAAATWCGTPIEMGHPRWVLAPLVLTPERVPVVTDVDTASSAPELTVLSAMTHGNHPDHVKILDTLAAALATADSDQAIEYAEIVLAVLPEAARRHWEALMTAKTFEFQSAYARRLKAEGEARAVLAVLDVRSIDVPDDLRARITTCSDPDQLEVWVRRAATVKSIDELFE